MRLRQLENTVLSQRLLIVVVYLSLFICPGACARAEVVEPVIVDVRVDLVRLLPNETSGQTVFLVDDAQQITIVLTANIELTSVSIALPESGTITPENISAEYGGSFRGFSIGSNPPAACHVLPLMCEPGHHYHFEFPSQGPGEYTVFYEAPSGLDGASRGRYADCIGGGVGVVRGRTPDGRHDGVDDPAVETPLDDGASCQPRPSAIVHDQTITFQTTSDPAAPGTRTMRR